MTSNLLGSGHPKHISCKKHGSRVTAWMLCQETLQIPFVFLSLSLYLHEYAVDPSFWQQQVRSRVTFLELFKNLFKATLTTLVALKSLVHAGCATLLGVNICCCWLSHCTYMLHLTVFITSHLTTVITAMIRSTDPSVGLKSVFLLIVHLNFTLCKQISIK